MRAWALAAFAGRHYGHPEDFENRKRDLLPKATEVAESVLRDSRLSSLQADTRTAVEVEAHNAAGIAYMRMGHFADLFSGTAEDFWRAADDHYRSALAIHPRDVRVLDNVSTLNLIRGSSRLIASKDEAARACFTVAIDAAQQAISNNSHDRFRHYNLSQALALSDEWHAASQEAGRIMKEPGAVKQEQVDNLKKAILAKDKTAIVNIYYPPKKS